MDNKNNKNNTLCQVCGQPLSGSICHNCGWTLIVYPDSAPQELIDMEKQRQEIMEQKYKELEGLKSLNKKDSESAPKAAAAPKVDDSPTSLPATAESKILGIVLISDCASSCKQGLPIYMGTNVYGTKPKASEGSLHHHRITLLTRTGAFMPEHFSLEIGENGQIVLYSLGNKTITSKGREFSTKKVTASDEIFIASENEKYKIDILKF